MFNKENKIKELNDDKFFKAVSGGYTVTLAPGDPQNGYEVFSDNGKLIGKASNFDEGVHMGKEYESEVKNIE